MFIIENYLEARRRKITAWENNRDKWISNDKHGVRSNRDYERIHPYPVRRWGKIGKTAIPVIMIHIVLVFVGFLIHDIATRPDKPKVPERPIAYNIGDSCKKYKIGDIGHIEWGDYEGAEVEIVGGCKNGQSYEVITTKDQTLFGKDSQHPGYDDVILKAGVSFKVNDSDNLMITDHKKE